MLKVIKSTQNCAMVNNSKYMYAKTATMTEES